MKTLRLLLVALTLGQLVGAQSISLHGIIAGGKRVGGGGETVIATDTFGDYAEYASLDAQTNWVNVSPDEIYIYGAVDRAAGAGGLNTTRLCGVRNTAAVDADHFSEIEISVLGSSTFSGIGACTRMQNGADSFYALTYFSNLGTVYLTKTIAGTQTTLHSEAKAYVSSNKVKLVATGAGALTRITAYENTSGSWVAIAGMSNIDPLDYLDGGYTGICAQGSAGLEPESRATVWRGGNN